MARPTKNNAQYFSHDANMRNDEKIRALRHKYGHMGYAVWCFLLETLTAKENFEIQYTSLNKELFAADYDVSETDFSNIVEYLVHLQLVQLDGDILKCENLIRRFEGLEELRIARTDAGRKGAQKRWQNHGKAMANNSKTTKSDGKAMANASESMANDSIINNNKEKDNIVNNNNSDNDFEVQLGEPTSALIEELKKESGWRNEVQMMFHILDPSQLERLIDEFARSCICNDQERHYGLGEVKRHFCNWLRKQQQNPKNNDNTRDNKQGTHNEGDADFQARIIRQVASSKPEQGHGKLPF